MFRLLNLLAAGVVLLAAAGPQAYAAEGTDANQSPTDVWVSLIKPHYFKDVELIEDRSVIDMQTPYRAEDAALTPITITAQIPQTPERYIEKLYIFVDKNPEPLAGVFSLTPDMGRADLAMRIRINEYTNVRAVAALNTGEHHMVTNFVKASGGCSAPLGADLKAAMARIGQMKFKTLGEPQPDQPLLAQFNVSHPNITGLQKDQKTQLIVPPHYVKSIRINYNGKPIMTADVGISISADPSFRFFFKPEQPGGELTAEVLDSKGMDFKESFPISL